ncbi:MAG: type II toxin-antitoxin system prevent-host-death family antitoxin [Chloroflexi bacterium]|nr:type II toxin-antitoxin system prevent-host-death family antitoxin [Chloroflexota bacterium]
MKTVGLRELKNRLSAYVREVRAGRSIAVTDRGQVVAELHPPGLTPGTRVPAAIVHLSRRGLVAPGAPNTPKIYPHLPRLLRSTTSRDLLEAERGTG